MADAVKVIDQEIDSLEEQLRAHSYHLYALRELRDKLQNQVSLSVPVNSSAPVGSITTDDRTLTARLVANLVRTFDFTKAEALRQLIRTGKVYGNEATLYTKCSPSFLGHEHDRIFEGTDYVR